MTTAVADPLAGLDAVPWADLDHAYGPATDVPNLLRELDSGSKERFDEALNSLFGNVWHQGTVYPATPYAVPFLLRILERGDPWAEGLAMLLAEIADGNGYMLVHARMLSSLRPTYEKIAADRGTTLEAEMVAEQAVNDACQAAVAERAELLIPFVEHGNSEIRESVLRGLARCAAVRPELKAVVLNAIADQTARETISELNGRLDDLPWFADAVRAKLNTFPPDEPGDDD